MIDTNLRSADRFPCQFCGDDTRHAQDAQDNWTCEACEAEGEPDDGDSDSADAEWLASAGMGTDEDYGPELFNDDGWDM